MARVSQLITTAAQSGVAGVDQSTVSHNAIICRECRGINGAVMQFSSMTAQEVGIERSQGWRSIVSREKVVEKGGSLPEMSAHTDWQ